jgi:ribosomal protein S18 acetylase RimI-like enzyme
VQTGWGMTGRLWAHELFDLPCPPDVVTWAKKAQNGVLFVSEELATFFQEEKKFNTTWEGDSTGMVRLLAKIEKLDLEAVRRTGDRARAGLELLAKEHREIIRNVRGAGVMLAFDVTRADLSHPLRERAFRRGLLMLPAGERTVRFYPRYDTEPSTIDEAQSILRAAIEDLVGDRVVSDTTPPALRIRVGTLTIPLDTVDIIELTPATFDAHKVQIMAIEQERYANSPLLKYPEETLETTMKGTRALGVAFRDRVSGRLVGYALGSAVEDHDEEGISSDPHVGENNTFYLQALAVLPSTQNAVELQNRLLDVMRERARAAGFEYLSTLIETLERETAPAWFKDAVVLENIENYLGSGFTFVYIQAALQD